MSTSARARLAARATVAAGEASRRLGLGGGSVIGGRIGLALDPFILAELAEGRTSVLVSGTNGKTTTTRMVAAALQSAGSEVATSNAGSNLPPGIAAALAASPRARLCALEVDEAHLPDVARQLGPSVVVLLNLSRDQLDRVSEVRMLGARWRQMVQETSAVVVANADDPVVTWAAMPGAQVRWIGAGQSWRADSASCPACGASLLWEDGTDRSRVVFAEASSAASSRWACSRCDLARPVLDAWVAGDRLERRDGTVLPIKLALPGRCNLANAAMAAVAAGLVGIDEADALGAMAGLTSIEGRFARVEHHGVEARLLLAKNPAGWSELLDLLVGQDVTPGVGRQDDAVVTKAAIRTAHPVVIGINARVADGRDPSWLWDVAFERLAGRFVVATGERCRDLAVRLRYGGVDHEVVPDQLVALGASGSSKVDYAGNYTAFQELRRSLVSPSRSRSLAGIANRLGARGGAARPHRRGSLWGAGLVEESSHGTKSGAPSLVRSPFRPSALRVVVVYPELLGTYGDSGNGLILATRARWRGIDAELILAGSKSPIPETGDIYCLGGGEDAPQVLAAELLASSKQGGSNVLGRAIDRGAGVLAVCAGFQLLGQVFPDAHGELQRGLGLLDVKTTKSTKRRAVGEVVARPNATRSGWGLLSGFENHSGITELGPGVEALAQVVTGIGNGAGDGSEGAVCGRVLGTYLHGPVLARNPAFADHLLRLVTGLDLAPLGDAEEKQLRAERLRSVGRLRVLEQLPDLRMAPLKYAVRKRTP